MDLTQVVKNVVLTKACSIKEDADSTASKTINLKVKFDGVDLRSVFAKAMSTTIVSWQNGQGRKHYTKWSNNQTVSVDFKAPAIAPQVEPEVAIIAKVGAMTGSEKVEYLNKLKAQLEELEED